MSRKATLLKTFGIVAAIVGMQAIVGYKEYKAKQNNTDRKFGPENDWERPLDRQGPHRRK